MVEATRLRDERRLTVDQVTATVEDGWLEFETTEDVPLLEAVFGQERAVRAIEFALGMASRGYNLYAAGPDGFGKSTVVDTFLRRRAAASPPAQDWIYVHDFEDPDHPAAISMPAGTAHQFAAAVRQAVESAAREMASAFESDSYARMRQQLVDRLEQQRSEQISALQARAAELNFALQFGPQGIASAPLIEGEPATEERFNALSEEEREQIAANRRTLEKELQEAMLVLRAREREAQDAAEQLDDETARYAVGHLFEALLGRHQDDPEIQKFLEAARNHLAENRNQFRQAEQPAVPGLPIPRPDPTRIYEVNVFVANQPDGGAPVIFETNPTYYNLVGRVEYQGTIGAAMTDHTLIRAGALARANGGYLVIRLRDLLNNAASLDALKRSLLSDRLQVENLSENFQLVPTTGLRPDPIPLHLKVILIGESMLYSLLYRYDPDFRELFKVKADFETDYARTRETANGLASVIRAEVERGGLLPFTRAAICRLVEFSSRMVEDQHRLSANMAGFVDAVRQADYWARQDAQDMVHERHVLRALDERVYRSSLVAERLLEAMDDGTIHVETAGERVGQINALSVYDLGDIAFGRPSRVTCVTSPGRGSIVMVERESEMAGRIHNKGFLILRGFLAHTFGQDKASLFHASLTFEQLYGDIDGDSASSTELYALLSSLADIPVDQRIAVTGSVDQMGRVQPIGGATAKIEGFFEVCRLRGLTGDQGVMIPRTNIENVVLSQRVAEAVAEGKFHIWAVDTIEEGIEVLTGVPAGRERDAEGRYPEGTVYRLVEDRLAGWASQLQRGAFSPSTEGHVPMPQRGPYPTPPGIPPSPPPEPPIIV
ncbi:MAG: AAA family ATPase [Dehalococcoidia bacterium]|nr:AAA family ATPase [Dehalococcoidia bacterium]